MSKINEEALLRTITDEETPKVRERKRIEVIATKLEEILKLERNKESRLAGIIARGFGEKGQAKNDPHPEVTPPGIIGQIESLLD